MPNMCCLSSQGEWTLTWPTAGLGPKWSTTLQHPAIVLTSVSYLPARGCNAKDHQEVCFYDMRVSHVGVAAAAFLDDATVPKRLSRDHSIM